MNTPKDQIVYPGSDNYPPEAKAKLGSIPVELYGEPMVRAVDTAYIMFQLPDLEKQRRFLSDFGMHDVSASEERLHMRGYGRAPYIYEAIKAKKPGFVGAGFSLGSEQDLQRVSSESRCPIESITGPGGGKRVRLQDPDGFLVDLVYGREMVEPIETRRDALAINLPYQKNRVNRAQRETLAPSAVERFGHYVLMVSDFDNSWRWYRKHLGLIPTDVQCTEAGAPVLAFNRLDKGSDPADHHSIVLSAGPRPGYMHSAFETCDQDSVGHGHQYLKANGWKHYWGIGRHILGSQIFDYWHDPHGFELEHYADGDVFDNSYPTHYHLFDRGGLWAWGSDLPGGMNIKVSFKDIMRLLFSGKVKRQLIFDMGKAMARAPRPWLK